MKPITCLGPTGAFIYGIHKPSFEVKNLRAIDRLDCLGWDENRFVMDNQPNFPAGSVAVPDGDWVFEVPNAFPFRGATFIAKRWADRQAEDPTSIRLPEPTQMSVSSTMRQWAADGEDIDTAVKKMFAILPEPLQLATAVNSTDPDDLVRLAHISCRFVFDSTHPHPIGLMFDTRADGTRVPLVTHRALFEAVANNPHLPDPYKKVMVLTPGIQGASEIVGEWRDAKNRSHVYEYLRKNSYIPWGHYAANMADDAIRYRIDDLIMEDMLGMRHLYYQRTYVRMAVQLGLSGGSGEKPLDVDQLEQLRHQIGQALSDPKNRSGFLFNRTLWGWNFGFDYAPSKYRLHASHQQVHQQYALLPATVASADGLAPDGGAVASYGCGDLVEDVIRSFHRQTGKSFFSGYIQALHGNQRMDGNSARPSRLIVYEDDQVIIFVPKAQTSQWELQLMTLAPEGNILALDTTARKAVDRGIFYAIKILGAMGARMITIFEFSKRFDAPELDQHLLYSFLPRLPESPGAFSEAQLRWINGHYPEDFAAACRYNLSRIPL